MTFPKTIQNFLTSIHFDPHATLSTAPTWVIRGKYPKFNQEVVIKIATTPRDSMRLRNHLLWAITLSKTVPKNSHFDIAAVLEDGDVGSLVWCIMPYVKGEPFARVNGDVTEITVTSIETTLPNIVSLLRFIEQGNGLSVAGIDGRLGGITKKDKLSLLQTAIEWARPDTPHLTELLQIMNANYRYLGTTNSHGDFTETNIVITHKNVPVLIDADISNAFNYKYYDVAEFYNRLYTRACSPELARTFLAAYVASLPKQTVRKFLNNFLCLSALRCIGNFMEIASLKDGEGKQKRLKYARSYAKEIVSRKILLIT